MAVAARHLQRLRLVALAAVRAEELLFLAVLRLRQLLEVRRLGGAVLELVGELVGRLAAPLQLLVQHLVLTDHLAQVVGRRGELFFRRHGLGAQASLDRRHLRELRLAG